MANTSCSFQKLAANLMGRILKSAGNKQNSKILLGLLKPWNKVGDEPKSQEKCECG